jgi:hypothetical protein
VFIEHGARSTEHLIWHGRRYGVVVPAGFEPPGFLVLEGLEEPPPGDAVLVLPRKATLLNFWRRPVVAQGVVSVEEL